MSTIPAVNPLSLPLVTRRVRAFFAPVNRALKQPTLFDPALSGSFPLTAPPAPWIDLGWIENFGRKSDSKIAPLAAGVPATPLYQVRATQDATITFDFKIWSKLTMALSAGSQHMNILAAAPGGAAIGSGAKALPASALSPGSSSTTLVLNGQSSISAGSIVSVDVDYTATTGYVGSGVSAAYVSNAANVGKDPDYVRRVTFNVARVAGVAGSEVYLTQPLLAGAPTSGMKVQQIVGFVDREGGSFFQEWSGLFVMPGEQGDRLIFHYPRLQAMAPAHETRAEYAQPIEAIGLGASFRALPIVDGNDSEQVLCYRSYVPGLNTLV